MKYPGKSKNMAIGLWFVGVFGFLNIHNLYLGRIALGLFKLILFFGSVVGSSIVLRNLAAPNPVPLDIMRAFAAGILIWNLIELIQIARLPRAEFGKSSERDNERVRVASLAGSAVERARKEEVAKFLEQIALGLKPPCIRLSAAEVGEVTDQNTLAYLAVHNTGAIAQSQAVKQLTDKTFIKEVLTQLDKNDENTIVDALLALGNEASLLSAIKRLANGKHHNDRLDLAILQMENLPGERSPEVIEQMFYAWDEFFNRKANVHKLASMISVDFLRNYILKNGTWLQELEGFVGRIDTEKIVAACQGMTDREVIRKAYILFKIVDGEFVKSPCEIDKHAFELKSAYIADTFDTDEAAEKNVVNYTTTSICKYCGKESTYTARDFSEEVWKAIRAGEIPLERASDRLGQ